MAPRYAIAVPRSAWLLAAHAEFGGSWGVKPMSGTRMLGAWQHKQVSCKDHARFSNGVLIK